MWRISPSKKSPSSASSGEVVAADIIPPRSLISLDRIAFDALSQSHSAWMKCGRRMELQIASKVGRHERMIEQGKIQMTQAMCAKGKGNRTLRVKC